MLVVVCGLPGVGKTTVAEAVADRVNGTVLRTDVVRKQVFDDPEYTEAESRLVYGELFSRAGDRLQAGEPVVLDGTFKRAGDRERARDVAADCGVAFRLVKVECDEATVRERIAAREDDASDADFEVHRTLREEFDPVEGVHLVVDNSGTEREAREQVADAF